jgi:quinol monooxygenase YgiN
MIAIARFELPLAEAEKFRGELEAVRDVLAEAKGFLSGTVGQNLDEPTLWVLTTEWENVGSYRRALEFYSCKVRGDSSISPSDR